MKTPDRELRDRIDDIVEKLSYYPQQGGLLAGEATDQLVALFDHHSARLVREELERIVAPVRTSRGPVEPSEITVDTRVRARLKALSDSGGGE